jgi:hypothetical protein
MIVLRSCIALSLALFIASGPAFGQIAASAKVSSSGVGPVKFGMTPAQAAAAGARLVPVGSQDRSCYFMSPASPRGVTFMVRGGKIIRADILKPAHLKTADGFTFGDKEANVAGFYASTPGGASDEALSDASDVTVVASPEFSSGASLPRLVYEITDEAGVVAIHAGYVPRGFDPHGCR